MQMLHNDLIFTILDDATHLLPICTRCVVGSDAVLVHIGVFSGLVPLLQLSASKIGMVI